MYIWVALQHHLNDHIAYRMEDTDDIPYGYRVAVPWGNSKKIGIVLSEASELSCEKEKIKDIDCIVDNQPILTKELLDLAHRLSQYYHQSLNNIILTMAGHLLKYSEPLPKELCYKTTSRILSKPSASQKKCLKLCENTPQTLASLLQHQVRLTTIRSLVEKEVLMPCKPIMQTTFPALKSLTTSQQKALSSIQSNGFHVNLLHGITGSGKTELYLHLMADCLQKGQSVLVLVPEIGLTPQTRDRFSAAIHHPVLMLHSLLNADQRFQLWPLLLSKTPLVVLGTRSAIFAPINNLGLIIVDEEHDGSLKQQTGWHYHARDVAIFRAHSRDVPIVLGSATPSLESYRNALQKKYHYIPLTERMGAGLPAFSIIDCRGHKMLKGFAPQTQAKLHQHIESGDQIMIFLNRRGYSPILMCHHCGHGFSCESCDHNLTYHQRNNALKCHRCERSQAKPSLCPSCQKDSLVSVGVGTEQVEEYLEKKYPDVPTARLDRDTVRSFQQFKSLLKKAQSGELKILIGTQLLAKGHDFPKLRAVFILDGDQGIYASDFRAGEHLIQRVLQVSGRCGRGQEKGTVYLQTHRPEHTLLTFIKEHNYNGAAQWILKERKQYQLPPFSHQAIIRAEAKQAQEAIDCLTQLKKRWGKHVECYGPFPAAVAKKNNKYYFDLLLNSGSRPQLHQWLSTTQASSSRDVRLFLDVDPIEA